MLEVYFVAPGGRDFSPFTALTFYMKASRSATIDVLGFGNDQGDFPTNVAFEGGVPVNTNWQKYYVPIPDPSKVTAETILLRFAEGPENNEGYTFWIDEAKFEDIGTFSNPVASIMGGENIVQLAYDGIDVGIEDVSYSVNLPNGVDQSYNCLSTYFDLQSSNEDVVRITPSNEIDIGRRIGFNPRFHQWSRGRGYLNAEYSRKLGSSTNTCLRSCKCDLRV